MLVVNSNAQNTSPTSWEYIFDTWYPDFKQLLYIPVYWWYDIATFPTLSISNTTVNFIGSPINQLQAVNINEYVQNYIAANSWLSVNFKSVLLWQFKWWEIVGKKCYVQIKHLINARWQNGTWSASTSSWTPVVWWSLLHTDGTNTAIWSITCTAINNDFWYWYLETAWITAQAWDRLLTSVTWYSLAWVTNNNRHYLRFGDNCWCEKYWPMMPIQVSID